MEVFSFQLWIRAVFWTKDMSRKRQRMAVDTVAETAFKRWQNLLTVTELESGKSKMLPQGLLLTSELCSKLSRLPALASVDVDASTKRLPHLCFLSLIGPRCSERIFNLLRRYCQRWLFHPHLYSLMGTLLLPWAPARFLNCCQKVLQANFVGAASSAPARRTGSESLE